MNIVKIFNKLGKYIISQDFRFNVNSMLGLYDRISDDVFLRKKFKVKMGKNLDLENPITFNEKLQWLKLFDRKPEYTMMVDKYLVREYVKEKLGEEYLIPLLGVWDSPEEIDFNALPDKFVIKCNHNSGLGMYICKDKNKINIESVKSELKKGLAQNYYLLGREWPYKDVPRKIIAEQYMEDESTSELTDYKFFCFNGEPKMILVCSNRFSPSGLRENFYDLDWNLLPVQRPKHPNSDNAIKKPETLGEMIRLAKVLAEDIPFSRIDFYNVGNRIYFGEITFFPASGMESFCPEEWDKIFGEWLKLPRVIERK